MEHGAGKTTSLEAKKELAHLLQSSNPLIQCYDFVKVGQILLTCIGIRSFEEGERVPFSPQG